MGERRATSRRTVLTAIAGAVGLGLTGAAVACAPGSPVTDGSAPPARVRLAYGPDPSQFGDLHLPAGTGDALPIVVLLHGGNWQAGSGLDGTTPLAADLAGAGVAVWNVEYRRVGAGGGYPQTLVDVAAAIDALPAVASRAAGGRLDPDRLVVTGHSSGGQLAVWAASRARLPRGAPGAGPLLLPHGAVSLAGMLDLAAADAAGIAGGAVRGFLGGRADQVPDRYAVSSPIGLLPAGVPVTCVHGSADTDVPLRQSEDYARAAGAQARLRVVDGVGHLDLVTRSSAGWEASRGETMTLLGT